MRIVFVHFGKTIPKFLSLNISRTMNLFPEHKVVLITNPECRITNKLSCELFLYKASNKIRKLHEITSHPKEFRDNFWFNTILRFFAIEELQKYQEEETLHVESDVILSKDFPLLQFTILQKSIAFPLVSRDRGIASIMYVRNLSIASRFTNFITNSIYSDPSTTDMIILRKFYELSPEEVQILPTLSAEKMDSFLNIEPDIQIVFRNAQNLFRGVFDGADYGIYFAGIDPRNNRGRRIIRHKIPNNYIQIENLNFFFNEERNFLNFNVNQDKLQIPIYNLHIHSKDPRYFNNKFNKLIRKRIKFYKLEPYSEFIFKIYINAIFKSILRRLKVWIPKRKSIHA